MYFGVKTEMKATEIGTYVEQKASTEGHVQEISLHGEKY